MNATLLLLLAEVAGPAVPGDDDPRRCDRSSQAIVVCARARTASPDRLRRQDDEAASNAGPPPADIALPGGGALGITTGRSSLGSIPGNRVMLRLRIPLGGHAERR